MTISHLTHSLTPSSLAPVKVSNFLAKYGSLNMFPVKAHVPIAFTCYASLSFKRFQLMSEACSECRSSGGQASSTGASSNAEVFSLGPDGQLPSGFFEVPEGFVRFDPKAVTKFEERMESGRAAKKPEHQGYWATAEYDEDGGGAASIIDERLLMREDEEGGLL